MYMIAFVCLFQFHIIMYFIDVATVPNVHCRNRAALDKIRKLLRRWWTANGDVVASKQRWRWGEERKRMSELCGHNFTENVVKCFSAVSDSPLLRNPFKLITIVTNLPLEKLLCRFLWKRCQISNALTALLSTSLPPSRSLQVRRMMHETKINPMRHKNEWPKLFALHVLLPESSINYYYYYVHWENW